METPRSWSVMKGTGGGEPGERSWLPGAGPSPRERQTPAFGLGTAGKILLFPPLWALLIAAALPACGRRASCLLGCSGVWGLGFSHWRLPWFGQRHKKVGWDSAGQPLGVSSCHRGSGLRLDPLHHAAGPRNTEFGSRSLLTATWRENSPVNGNCDGFVVASVGSL